MNKSLVVILLVLVIALLCYRFGVQDRSQTLPDEPAPAKTLEEKFNPQTVDGIETDEAPEFDVVVETRMEGRRPVLDFTITETHGWAVTLIYLRADHGWTDQETGEWERDPALTVPPKILCPDMLHFGKTLVAETTLTSLEMGQIGNELGTAENWRAEVYQWGKVYKPKP
jgi:hypothetical protein